MFVSPKKMRSFMDSYMNKLLKDKEFTASQLPFIMEVGDNEGISMKDLCTSLGADKGLTTRVIRNLIENGFVENRSESSRTYKLFLTKKGEEAFDYSKSAMEDLMSRMLECLDEEDKVHLRSISAKLNKRLDELYKY
ncbi:MAG: winged helix-turn-helix transcriptional regulator [Methanomassiliicoccus sp.]|nr:winged helix-turn-helix transcriptional regulator [Methanomassiliicoccus sp.]